MSDTLYLIKRAEAQGVSGMFVYAQGLTDVLNDPSSRGQSFRVSTLKQGEPIEIDGTTYLYDGEAVTLS